MDELDELDFVVLLVLIECCDSRHYSFSHFSLYRPRITPELVGELPPGRAGAHGGHIDSAVANFQKSKIARIETC